MKPGERCPRQHQRAAQKIEMRIEQFILHCPRQHEYDLRIRLLQGCRQVVIALLKIVETDQMTPRERTQGDAGNIDQRIPACREKSQLPGLVRIHRFVHERHDSTLLQHGR
ncbi:hypothetical protein [Bradyrhizobium sp.]|uniref:hypothetical protein n=1 Tax=Bradyrhizobium sp. TaxID=376 RepID=UPI001ECD4EF4|nr:hypothetical protein [Bradyrhizobium sp.]MBV9985713.1 hypothetical protein [Bradyrhizobium sp.]